MNVLHIAVSAVLLLAGCSGPEKAPPAAASAADAGRAEAVTAPQTFTKEKPAGPAQETRVAPATPAPVLSSPVATPEMPAAKAPAVALEPPRKEIPAAPVSRPAMPASKPAAPVAVKVTPPPAPKPSALDLDALEKRLKETSAIGVMTKLTLKNQVDDLLERFRAHYDGRAKTTLAQLRQPYDTLILKVLAALQDGDPSLAKAVADSREAIWAVLSNPEKFRNL